MMIISFDLTGLFLLIVLPPIIVYLCGNAYELRHHWSNLKFNKIAKQNLEFQIQIRDLYLESRDLQKEILDLRKELTETYDIIEGLNDYKNDNMRPLGDYDDL